MSAEGLTGILKLIHVLFAVAWLGGAVLLTAYGMRLLKADVRDKIAFTKQMLFAGKLFSLFAAVALVAGVWLVLRVDFFGFDQAWISIGFVAIAVGAVLGPAFYARQGSALLDELESGNPAAAARMQRIGMVATSETVLLVVALWAMIYKPGL